MTDPRSRGPLSPADRKLWERVVGDVRPLKERPPADPSPAPDSEKTPAKAPPRITKAPAPRRPALPPPKPPPELRPGSTAGVDKRTANRFRRGQMAIDGRLDLHGYTQEPAYAALRGFITGAAGRRPALPPGGHRQGLPGRGRGRCPARRRPPLAQPAPVTRPGARHRAGPSPGTAATARSTSYCAGGARVIATKECHDPLRDSGCGNCARRGASTRSAWPPNWGCRRRTCRPWSTATGGDRGAD